MNPGIEAEATTSEKCCDTHAVLSVLYAMTGAADAQDWATWSDQFAPDAVVDYSAAGGAVGEPGLLRDQMAPTFQQLSLVRHLVTNGQVDFNGDGTAVASALFLSPIRGQAEGPASLVGGTYRARLGFMDGRWRIKHLSAAIEWNL